MTKKEEIVFFRRQEQLESRIFAKMDEIKQQEERIEQLEWREETSDLGLNRQGTGLEMSVKKHSQDQGGD